MRTADIACDFMMEISRFSKGTQIARHLNDLPIFEFLMLGIALRRKSQLFGQGQCRLKTKRAWMKAEILLLD